MYSTQVAPRRRVAGLDELWGVTRSSCARARAQHPIDQGSLDQSWLLIEEFTRSCARWGLCVERGARKRWQKRSQRELIWGASASNRFALSNSFPVWNLSGQLGAWHRVMHGNGSGSRRLGEWRHQKVVRTPPGETNKCYRWFYGAFGLGLAPSSAARFVADVVFVWRPVGAWNVRKCICTTREQSVELDVMFWLVVFVCD